MKDFNIGRSVFCSDEKHPYQWLVCEAPSQNRQADQKIILKRNGGELLSKVKILKSNSEVL